MKRRLVGGLAVVIGAGVCLLGAGCSRHLAKAGGDATAHEVRDARARVERDPTAAAWVALGQAYLKQGDERDNDAFIAFRQALRLESHNAEALGGLGEAELRLGDAQDALVWADRALAAQADAAAPLGVRGRARLAEGAATGAVPDLERAVNLDPSLLEARLSLISAYVELRRTDQALSQANQIVTRFPKEPRGHYAYAALLDARQQWAGAEHEYREGLRLDPSNTAMKLFLALLLFNQHKNYEEVQHLANEVDAAAPGDGSAAGLAAWALFLSGKQDGGMRALLQANHNHPRNLQILRWIKTGADQTGRPEVAEAATKDIDQLTKRKS